MIFDKRIPLRDFVDESGGGSYIPKQKSLKEKKKEIKKLLNGDIELLNEIIVELRKEKINKLKNK